MLPDPIRLAVTHTWQVGLLIVLVWILCRTVARRRAHLAHLLWLVVILKCLIPPVWSSHLGIFCWMQAATPTRYSIGVTDLPLSPNSETPALGRSRPGVNHAVVPWESVLPSQLGSERPHGVARSDVVKVAPTDRDASGHAWTIVLLGWSSVTALLIASSLIRITRCLRRAIRAQSATQPELDRLLHRLKTQLKVKRAVRLVVTQAAIGPAVLGLVRPVILIPERILRGRSAEQLEPMLAHELLHIRRGDLWIGMLQVVAQAIWWFNPLVWYASRTISREAEPTRGSRFIGR